MRFLDTSVSRASNGRVFVRLGGAGRRRTFLGDMFNGDAGRRRHAGVEMHHAVTCASRRLFARSHCDRYFGGLWFKIFSERGPC